MKASCEAFIMAVTKLTVEPMLSFITKVTAVKVATSHSTSKRLREQVSIGCGLSQDLSSHVLWQGCDVRMPSSMHLVAYCFVEQSIISYS